MDFFQKGGGIRANPKVLGHFLCTNNFGILGRKGGGWTKSKSFWALFTLVFGEILHWQKLSHHCGPLPPGGGWGGDK